MVRAVFLAGSLGLAVLGSCSTPVDEDNFADKVATPYCKQLKRCARGFFESEYKDMDDCIDEAADDVADLTDLYDDAGCDFDEDGAQECLDFLHSADCEDFYEDFLAEWDWGECESAYDC